MWLIQVMSSALITLFLLTEKQLKHFFIHSNMKKIEEPVRYFLSPTSTIHLSRLLQLSWTH